MTPVEAAALHAAFRHAHTVLSQAVEPLRKQEASVQRPDTLLVIGETLGTLGKACALLAREVDDARRGAEPGTGERHGITGITGAHALPAWVVLDERRPLRGGYDPFR